MLENPANPHIIENPRPATGTQEIHQNAQRDLGQKTHHATEILGIPEIQTVRADLGQNILPEMVIGIEAEMGAGILEIPTAQADLGQKIRREIGTPETQGIHPTARADLGQKIRPEMAIEAEMGAGILEIQTDRADLGQNIRREIETLGIRQTAHRGLGQNIRQETATQETLEIQTVLKDLGQKIRPEMVIGTEAEMGAGILEIETQTVQESRGQKGLPGIGIPETLEIGIIGVQGIRAIEVQGMAIRAIIRATPTNAPKNVVTKNLLTSKPRTPPPTRPCAAALS